MGSPGTFSAGLLYAVVYLSSSFDATGHWISLSSNPLLLPADQVGPAVSLDYLTFPIISTVTPVLCSSSVGKLKLPQPILTDSVPLVSKFVVFVPSSRGTCQDKEVYLSVRHVLVPPGYELTISGGGFRETFSGTAVSSCDSSFGPCWQTSATIAGFDITLSRSGEALQTGEANHNGTSKPLLLELDFTILDTNPRNLPFPVCFCDALQAYVDARFVCNDTYFLCPLHEIYNEIPYDFHCDDQGKPTDRNCEAHSTTTLPSNRFSRFTAPSRLTSRAPKTSTVSAATTSNTVYYPLPRPPRPQSSVDYTTLLTATAGVVVVLVLALFFYALINLRRQKRAVPGVQGNALQGQVNLIVTDEDDLPPPYTPPGAPPSYHESFGGETMLAITGFEESETPDDRGQEPLSAPPDVETLQSDCSHTDDSQDCLRSETAEAKEGLDVQSYSCVAHYGAEVASVEVCGRTFGCRTATENIFGTLYNEILPHTNVSIR